MRLLSFLLAIQLALLLPASSALVDPSSALQLPASGWRLWPGESRSTLKLDEQEETTVVHLIKSDQARAYCYFPVNGGTLYHLSIRYRYQGNRPPVFKTAFRDEQGTPGGAPSVLAQSRPVDDGWHLFELTVLAPVGTTACQLIANLPGGNGELWIGETLLEGESGLLISSGEVDGDPLSEFWTNQPGGGAFWNVDPEATGNEMQTEVKLAYDHQHLYLLFINSEPSLASAKRQWLGRDEKVWEDESNEVYIVNTGGEARQFISNINGAQWDGRLYQKIAGDPFQADSTWNGQWRSVVKTAGERWYHLFVIPFSDLGETPKRGTNWGVHFTRHRYAGLKPERTRWNHFRGANHQLDCYASLLFGASAATLTRFVAPIEPVPLDIKRENVQYASLLGDEAGEYIVGDWGSGFYLGRYSDTYQRRYNAAQWLAVQEKQLVETSKTSTFGPPYPMGPHAANWAIFDEAFHQAGLRFPYAMTTSGVDRRALEAGATFYDNTPFGTAKARVAEFDPRKQEALFMLTDEFLEKNRERIPSILCFDVVDEPTNSMFSAFSRTIRPDAGLILDGVEEEIRAGFGNGKYGLWDARQPESERSPYERIAFVQWWNHRMAKWGADVRGFLEQKAPETPIVISNQNTVGDIPLIDVPLLSQDTDWLSVDPYPTAVLALSGRDRALYHTGFATKWVRDLGGEKPTRSILQAFIYHDHTPNRSNVREWASQALKSGASILCWYNDGPAEVTIPEVWQETQKINRQVKNMKRLRLPEKSRTVIFHSLLSQAGLNDRLLHSQYTLYTLLGERLGSWFRFVGDTQKDTDALSQAALIYLPQAAYLSRPVAERLLKEVQRGATLVVLDPLAFHSDEYGVPLKVREALLGGKLGQRHEAKHLLTQPGALAELPESVQLPLTPVAAGIHRGRVLAYHLSVPEDGVVFARYEDGNPAAYHRKVGKGRVIYFGALPYGNSELAIADSPWLGFHQRLAASVGEATSLPIWSFYLSDAEISAK